MTASEKTRRRWIGGGVGALLAVGAGLVLLQFPDLRLSEHLTHLSYDLPFRWHDQRPPGEAVVVYLDDASHQQLEQPYSAPWNRGLYARLLDRLTAEKARAVSFDILFSNPNPQHPEGDQQFARAIKENGKVVLGAEFSTAPGGGWTFYRALEAFSDEAAAWGMVQLQPDQDFIVRKHLHVPPHPDAAQYPSISWQLARLAGAPTAQNLTNRFHERWLRYYGPTETLPGISFVQALETNGFCPAGFFKDKVVLVGASLKTYATGERKDELRTPYTRTTFCPAVDVQATQVLNLIRADWLDRNSHLTEVVLIILTGLLTGYTLSLFRPLHAVVLAVVGAVVLTAVVGLYFWQARAWFPWMVVLAVQLPCALLWSLVYNSVQLYVQNRLYEQSLQMYLSPKLVRKFAASRDLLRPGAKKELLTILFSDIADFTSISEGVDSDELARVMNAYFQTAVAECIHATDGTIVKYIGDAIFSFWNAPDAQADHALRACEAALRFRDLPLQTVRGRALMTRIGLHTGVANVGNFGSDTRVDYTAIGESINLASRMEGLNKYLGTRILISEDTRKEIGDRLLVRFVGPFRLKGFEKPVGVYELAGRPEQSDNLRSLHETFATALELFKRRDFDAAEKAFQKVLAVSPGDGPASYYLKLLPELRRKQLPENWSGEVELAEK